MLPGRRRAALRRLRQEVTGISRPGVRRGRPRCRARSPTARGGGDHGDAQHGRRELGGETPSRPARCRASSAPVRYGTDVEPLPRRPSTGGTGCDEQVGARRRRPGEIQGTSSSGRLEQGAGRCLEQPCARPLGPARHRTSPAIRRPAPKTSVTVKWTASGPRRVLDRDDPGEARPIRASLGVHHQVDRVADQVVESAQRQVPWSPTAGPGTAAGSTLASRNRVDRGVSGHARRQGQQQG